MKKSTKKAMYYVGGAALIAIGAYLLWGKKDSEKKSNFRGTYKKATSSCGGQPMPSEDCLHAKWSCRDGHWFCGGDIKDKTATAGK